MRLLVSERFPADPQVRHAASLGGPEALGLWLVTASWCAWFDTDVIDVDTVYQLTTVDDEQQMIVALVAAHLWEELPPGENPYPGRASHRAWRVLHEGLLWDRTPGLGALRRSPG